MRTPAAGLVGSGEPGGQRVPPSQVTRKYPARAPGVKAKIDFYFADARSQGTTIGAIDSRSQRASDVILASSCCCPITWTPTGRPPTLISGTVTAGANSIELGALKTKSPVGRGASG